MTLFLTLTLNCFLGLGVISLAVGVAQAIVDDIDWKTTLTPLALTPVLVLVCYAMLYSGPL